MPYCELDTVVVGLHRRVPWWHCVFAGSIVFALSGVDSSWSLSSTAHAESNLTDYIRNGLVDFEKSERVTRTRAALAVLVASGEEAAIESPYSLAATASQNFNQLPDPSEGELRSNTAATGSLRMRRRSGWEAGIAASVDYNRFDTTGGFYPYRVRLDLAYDVTQGGARGVAKTTERLAITSAKQRVHETKQALVDLRVEYITLLVNLYGANCTLLQLHESRKRVAKTIEVAAVMRQTRTMSNKDFLNFVQVQDSFDREIASSQSLVRVLQEQVRRWGNDAYRKARTTIARIQSCENEVEATLARVSGLDVGDARIASAASSQPGALAARAAVVGAELRLHLELEDRKPSVSPFVQLDLGRSGQVQDDLASVFVGVRLDWQPRTKRRRAAQRVRQLGIAEARNSRDVLLLDNRARLHTLWVDIKTQTQIIASLRSSVETSKELIETLETERSVGLVDSLSYNNALINANATKLQLLASWAALERSMLEFEVYLSLLGSKS